AHDRLATLANKVIELADARPIRLGQSGDVPSVFADSLAKRGVEHGATQQLIVNVGNVRWRRSGDLGRQRGEILEVGDRPVRLAAGDDDGVEFALLQLLHRDALLDGVDSAILIDTTQRGGAPGTLYVIEPSVEASAGDEPGDPYAAPILMSPHEMDPAKVLQTVRMLGGGCEESTA
ncbi:hypothetical protein B4Q13_18545, partial [Lacticaseibacillus rhamnosus]